MLESFVQLHEVVEIHYLVDCYQAQLYTRERLIGEASGDTIAEAIDNLTALLIAKGLTLQQIRQL